MSLVQALPEGPLDIVGDVHGEMNALVSLLRHLGYDAQGRHAQGRTLVFVGDLCDRGPDSPAVLALAERLIDAGRACAVLGNHEINLLRNDAKDGAGWYFDQREARDQDKYAPFVRPSPTQRARIPAFLGRLPIALERADLRVVHAAWVADKIEAARALPEGSLRTAYGIRQREAEVWAKETGLRRRMAEELRDWPWSPEDRDREPPFLHARAEYEIGKRMTNPLQILASGVERKGTRPFFSGGKWRFVDRAAWWNEYDEATPVVIGHYWRRYRVAVDDTSKVGLTDLFAGLSSVQWHGLRGNVFCVDYSVGGRWIERKRGRSEADAFRLAALRWPERELQFDDGERCATEGFGSALQV